MATATKPKKPATKATKTTKTAKKPTTTSYGVERSADTKWNDTKVAVFKALKSLKAVGEVNAVSAIKVAAKGENISPRDVRHYCYHAMVSGLTGVARVEGVRGYAFYLTAKGAALDLHKQQSKS